MRAGRGYWCLANHAYTLAKLQGWLCLQETQKIVEEAGRQALLVPGDLSEDANCQCATARPQTLISMCVSAHHSPAVLLK